MLGFRTNGAVRWLRWKVKLATGLCLAACYGLAVAQPANDNFSSAEALDVTLLHGSVTADTTQATIEAGEPNHAGLIVTNTVWYTWVAPQNGEVTFETYGSDYNNVLAVYRGAALGNLAQLGSSYGAAGFIQREAVYRGPVAAGVVRFNAQVGNTYRIAVGGRGAGGNMVLNWAYHSSGTFRFTTQMFECADTESEIIGNDTVAIREHNQPGVLVTVTRVGGSSGRVLVDYATEDGTALAPTPPDNNGDYWPAAGTLEFRDFELSKTILITVRPNTPAILTEDNMLSRYFIVRLSNPRLAAEESLEVSPPKLDPVMSASIVRIYDTSYDPELELNRDEETGELVGPLYRPVFNFSKRNYQIAEDVTNRWGSVVIWVDRSPGTNIGVTLHYEANSEPWWSGNQLDNTFRLQAASDYATPDPENAGYDGLGPDFGPITGTVTWGQDDWDPKPIRFDIYMDDIVEFNEDIIVNLWREDNGRRFTVGTVNQATITILHNDKTPPAGSLDQHHNADYAVDMEPPVITAPPSMAHPGADGVVFDLAVQEDDKTIIVGDFQSFNTVPINRIARMNYNGSLDTSFNPGDGANNFISTLELVPGGKIVIGGAFTFFNGTQRKSIARLNNDGSLDTSFDPGTGADGTIWAVAVQADGKVVVAGDFTSINGVPRLRVARLNEDGSVDASFDPGVNGPNGLVNALVLGSGGQVIIAGEFSALGALAHNNIARLNANGSIDNGFRFSIGLGFDGPIYALARQSDGRLLVGGEFSHFNVANRTRIARLNANGTLDTGFDPGTGANDTVYSIDPQSNGLIYVGGLFTSYNGTHRLGFTRLYADGTVDTSFLDTAYNQFAGLPRKYFNPGVSPKPFVWASGVQTDGNVMIGGGFDEVGGGQRERRGRVQWEDYSHNHREFLSRAGIRNRNNVARLVGGGTRGPGNIGLYYDNYSVNQDQGFLHVSLVRANGDLGYLAANFSVLPGSTQSGVDYLYNSLSPVYLGPWPSMVHMVSDGFFGVNTVLQDRFDTDYKFNVDCRVTLTILNPMIDGNRFSDLQLANPSVEDHFFLGGENIPIAGALGRSMADFTIVDDNRDPGVLGFEVSSFSVNEGTNAVITVTRTNGSYGSASIQFATANGTALSGVDYYATNGTMNFVAGQTNKSFMVRLLNNFNVQPVDRTVNLRLFNANSATMGLTNAVLSLVDDDYPPGFVNFAGAAVSTNEAAGTITLTVRRSGGSSGTLTVQCGTTNGTAINGTHYLGLTNTLTWNPGDSTPRYVTVPLIDNAFVGGSTFFTVSLFDAKVNTAPAPTVLGGAFTRTTVNILEDDGYGTVQFSAPQYKVNENGGVVTLTVVRTSGSAETVRVNYSTADGSAVSSGVLPNYLPTAGSLTLAPDEVAKSFDVVLLHDGLQNGSPFFFTVQLTDESPAGVLGPQSSAVVNIVDAESYNEPPGALDTIFDPVPGFNADIYSLALQPDGQILAAGAFTRVNSYQRNRVVRLNADASLDNSFMDGLGGANAPVRTMLLQSDGRVVVGGEFTFMNGVVRNRLARLVSDGNLDTSFDPGSGADGSIFALAESFVGGNRQLLVGGNFITVNGLPREGLARLKNDGAIDPDFNPTLVIRGSVYAIAVYPTNTIQAGKILVAGDFSSVEGVARGGIARLNPNGTLDGSFDPGTGANGVVRALAIQPDGKVLLGGSFTNFNGQAINRLARLNVNGTMDSSFQTGTGANDTVEAITLQADNRIVVVGQFTAANGVSRRRITRLMQDGTPDPALNFGTGANGLISSVLVQPDGRILAGGGFTEYDGQARQRLARIYGGSVSGAGSIEFTDIEYQIEESSTNALITLRRRGGTSGKVTAQVVTSPITAIPGVNYSNVTAALTFPAGETFHSVVVPILDDLLITPDLSVLLTLQNVSAPATLGNIPFATLTIVNTDSTVTFSSPTYRVNENLVGGMANIQLVRNGSTHGVASVDFITTTNGTAIAGTNYLAVTNTVVFAAGKSNVTVQVPILHNPVPEGPRTVQLMLTNALNTVLFDPSMAELTIQDVDNAPGQLYFSATNYVALEGQGHMPVTILRTNGFSGVISVNFAAIPGTALPNIKYWPTNGSLTFGDGEMSKTFTLPIIDDSIVGGSSSLTLRLSGASGGATILPPATTPVTILDNDPGITFSSAAYVVAETESSVFLTVFRTNAAMGTTTVKYATTNVTALAGTNYGSTSGTLTFANGESIKTFSIPIMDDPRVTGNLSFSVSLFDPSVPAQLLDPSTTVVNITDSDPGITFVSTNSFVYTNFDSTLSTNAAFAAVKSGTNVLITVLRSNANTGIVTVNYATSNRTAVAGVDYTATSGLLTFSNGVSLQSFTVPIVNNRLVQGDRAFDINLFNPSTGVQLVAPARATVVITDDISGLQFSAPAYSLAENGVAATISVLRTSFTNSTVSVNYSTANGTALAGVNYVAATGTLTFTNGEVMKTFTVPVIDNTVVDGDHTVLLSLSDPVGNALLVEPSAATLSVLEADGSLIVPAGSAIQAESGPVNGVIDPGETVTMLLSLRNASGTNTANLVATLVSSTSVSNPSGPQNYGNLSVRGASAFRPFTFTANGTNGQPLNVVLQLEDNGRSMSNVVYALSIGNIPSVWSNSTAIVINDFTNATPYPSVINVSGINGTVNKATVTLTNFNHTWPRDVNAILVAPGGQKSYLMAKAGSSVAANNVTLTFDDAAPAALPFSSALVSGTYRPSAYSAAPPPFPVPAPPPPYATNLSVFNGSNPNGAWSLYVYDDKGWDYGMISNGWILRLHTGAPAAADAGLAMVAAPTTVVAGSNVSFTLSVANFGPGNASNIVVSDVLPAAYVSGNASQGTFATNGAGLLTWNLGALSPNANATLNVVVQPTVPGLITNVATLNTSTTDLNLDNNAASAIVNVVVPTADLVLGLSGAPNPILVGGLVTYAITVTNLGPATASGVSISDTLPPGFVFVSASPVAPVVSGRNITFANLGDLSSGSHSIVSVVARPLVAGTFTNAATCSSTVTDPLKGNNSLLVKTDVEGLHLNAGRAGNALVFSWENNAGVSLQTTTSLVPPVVWTSVTNAVSVSLIGEASVSIPIQSGNRFFRLSGGTQ